MSTEGEEEGLILDAANTGTDPTEPLCMVDPIERNAPPPCVETAPPEAFTPAILITKAS